MEKFWSFAKWILIAVVIFAVLGFLGGLSFGQGSIFDTISSWFDTEPVIIDSFKDAPTNYIGYTKHEIDTQTGEEQCPSKGNISDTIYIQDYLDGVVFYKQISNEDGSYFYPNILFLKTEKGLVFDGCLNLSAVGWAWFGNEASFEWYPEFDKIPTYNSSSIVVLSSGMSHSFCRVWGLFQGYTHEGLLNRAQEYIIKNLYPYFLSYYNDNIKIYQGEETSAGDFNAFYTYLYESSKLSSDNKVFVDVTDLTFFPIAEADRHLYPRTTTEEDKSETYLFYDFSLKLKVYKESFDIFCIPHGAEDNIDTNVEDDEVTDIEIPLRFEYVVEIVFGDSAIKNPNYMLSDRSYLNFFKDFPVTISLFSGEILVSQHICDNYAFDCYASIPMPKGSYSWKIDSEKFQFDAYSGSVTISGNCGLEFWFTYVKDESIVNISLHPILGQIYEENPLEQYPVSIIIENEENRYKFDFNSVDAIFSQKVIKHGSYTYMINSNYLIFEPKSGTLEINAETRNLEFLFSYPTEVSTLSLKTEGYDEPTGNISISIHLSVVTQASIDKVYIYCFKNDGTMTNTLLEKTAFVDVNSLNVCVADMTGSIEGSGIYVKDSAYQIKIVKIDGSIIFSDIVGCSGYVASLSAIKAV